MKALERARLHPDAVSHALVAEVGTPWPDRDRDPCRRSRGESHLPVTQEDERPDVALAEPVRAHRLDARLHQLRARVRHGQLEGMRRTVEPVDVFAQAEDRRAPVVTGVAADSLEHPETVVQRVSQHVDLRRVPRHEDTVEPDALALLHPRSS